MWLFEQTHTSINVNSAALERAPTRTYAQCVAEAGQKTLPQTATQVC